MHFLLTFFMVASLFLFGIALKQTAFYGAKLAASHAPDSCPADNCEKAISTWTSVRIRGSNVTFAAANFGLALATALHPTFSR